MAEQRFDKRIGRRHPVEPTRVCWRVDRRRKKLFGKAHGPQTGVIVDLSISGAGNLKTVIQLCDMILGGEGRFVQKPFCSIGGCCPVVSPLRFAQESLETLVETVRLGLIGDIAIGPDGKPSVHVHAVLGRHDGTALAGHLQEAHVRPTLEIIVTESPAHLRKTKDPASGLALIGAGV